MNPLTLVKRIQKINTTEAALGVSEDASWHAKYKESAYVFVGGIPFDLTEGDLLAVFAQYGEIVDVNLVRDRATGKSKGFAFLAYEDQRSTILAVDNLNGAKLLGRIIRVDHVSNYKKKEEEDEEKEQEKREARGVCYAFQRGECNRGAACKFSHNEQRSANTGWGEKDSSSRWDHDKYEGPLKRKSDNIASDRLSIGRAGEESKSGDKHGLRSRKEGKDGDRRSHLKHSEPDPKDQGRREVEKRRDKYDEDQHEKQNWDKRENGKSSRRHEFEQDLKEDWDRQRTEKCSKYDEADDKPNRKDDRRSKKQSRYYEDEDWPSQRDKRGNEKWSGYNEVEDRPNKRDDTGKRSSEKRSRYDKDEGRLDRKEDRDKRGSDKRSRYDEDEGRLNRKEDRDKRGSNKRSRYDEDEDRLSRKEDVGKRGSEKRSKYNEDRDKQI